MSPAHKTVLLIVHLRSHYVELRRVAWLLKDSARYRPIVFFARAYDEADRDAEECMERDVEAAGLVQTAGRMAAVDSADLGLSTRLRRWLARRPRGVARLLRSVLNPLLQNPLTTWIGPWLERARQVKRARRLLAKCAPTLLILAEDNVEYETAALVRAAHERGIRVAIVPFTVATAREPAELYVHEPQHQVRGWVARGFARRYPQWVYEHDGQPLLRLPVPRALALHRVGLAPPRPWAHNSGDADRLAVESEAMLEHYLREGLPHERLVVTGSLADDVLARGLAEAEGRREELYRELALPPGKPLILCALPPDQIVGGRESGFATYDALVSFWLDALADDPAWNVVVALHPRERHLAGRIPSRPGLVLVARDTAALVPLCSLFVASVSATIRWALACGRPVVNFDVYRYRYEDYVDVTEVVTVEDPGAFVDALREGRRRAAAGERSPSADRWGRLDGRSGERLLALFDDLCRADGPAVRNDRA